MADRGIEPIADAPIEASEWIHPLDEFLFLTLMPSYTVVGNGPEGDRIEGPD